VLSKFHCAIPRLFSLLQLLSHFFQGKAWYHEYPVPSTNLLSVFSTDYIKVMRIEPLADHPHLIATIAKLLHEEWSAFRPWASLRAIEARLLASAQLHHAPFTVVALSALNEFLGTASVKLFELAGHPDKEHWLGEVFIPNTLRGRGIGSALTNECIRRSIDLGIQALYLYTPDQQKLYERFGWHEVEQSMVDGEAVSIMVRIAAQNASV
jgi:predicted N-acetyltransferase YhbS